MRFSYAVVIAGAGGMAREAHAWLLASEPTVPILGFVVGPQESDGELYGLPVRSGLGDASEMTEALGVVLAIGRPDLRRRAAVEAGRAGASLRTVTHPRASLGPGVVVADGAIVGPHVTVTRDVAVGSGSILNYACAVGHDGHVGDFAFIGPGAVLGGDVRIEDDAYIGLGARVLPGCSIGARAVVGAGAVVTRDVPPDVTVVGVPATRR